MQSLSGLIIPVQKASSTQPRLFVKSWLDKFSHQKSGRAADQIRLMLCVYTMEGPDALARLADQMQKKICFRFSPTDCVALRLHVDGKSDCDIAPLWGDRGLHL